VRDNKTKPWKLIRAALCVAAFVGLATGFALADDGSFDDLLEKLKTKGVLTEEEYQALKKAREEEAAKAAAAKQPKIETSPAIKRIQLFGDLRLRYESRAATSTFPIAEVGGANEEQLDRFRYAARVGIRGDLTERWFYGLRLETSANPRSPWATFGNTNSNTAGGAAPYGKAGIFVGQAYLGWKPTPWLTLQAGKMPNPVFTTPMVWDSDINPEGLSERFNFELNDHVGLFANLGQYVYSQFAPNDDSGTLGFAGYEGYQFVWQVGMDTTFGERKSARVALGFYHYSGFGAPDFPGSANNNPSSSGFAGPFAFGPQNTLPDSPAGLAFANGLNSLRYLEVPWEVNFPIGSIDASVFGDLSYNIQASDRAAQGSYASLGSQGTAYQLGLSVGTNLGLAMNQVAAKKNTWDVRAYWQSIGLNALDPNIIDADFFGGRTNMQGVFLAAGYSPTDAIITALRLGDAHRVNGAGPTPGSNPDLSNVQPMDSFKLLQVDLGWRF
jgi:hypothetical protein